MNWLILAVAFAWVALRFHSKLFEVPSAGVMYDLATLIMDPCPEEPKEPVRSFAVLHTVDETELSVAEIRQCLFDAKALSDYVPATKATLEDITTPSSVAGAADGHDMVLTTKDEIPTAVDDSWHDGLTLADISTFFKPLASHSEVRRLLQTLEVYIDDFSAAGFYAVYLAVKDYLREPEASSIARDTSGEADFYRNSFDILSKVNLLQHVCDVTQQMVVKLSGFSGMTRKISEGCLLAAIYHDLGKLKYFRDQYVESTYRMTDHAQISEDLLRHRLNGVSAKTLNAILYHHKPKTSNPETSTYSELLREADQAARAKELRSKLQDVPELSEVIHREDLIQLILSILKKATENARVSSWPSAFVLSGYVLVSRGSLISALHRFLDRELNAICREQYLSAEQFESAAVMALEKCAIITAELRSSIVSFVYKSNSMKKRKMEQLPGYVAIPVESLSHLASSLPETPSVARSIAKIEFQRLNH